MLRIDVYTLIKFGLEFQVMPANSMIFGQNSLNLVEVQGQTIMWYCWKIPVTRILHAKYECFAIYCLEEFPDLKFL